MSADLSDYAKWYAAAKRSASAAHDVYERGTVEHELALHLLRALRELEAPVSPPTKSGLAERTGEARRLNEAHPYTRTRLGL